MESRSRTVTQWSAGVFFITHGLEIHRDTEGRADLVLAAIALTDRAGLVVVHHKVLGELCIDILGGGPKLFGERQHSAPEGGKGGVEVHDHTGVVLFGVHHLLVVGIHQESQRDTVGAREGSMT